MNQVAILGSGPAALLAALAAEQSGLTPEIFAKGEKSEMFGAMYLHRAIPGLHTADESEFEIDIIKVGTQEGYAYNTYGKKDAPVSWEKFSPGPTPAWSLKDVYDTLWERYQGIIRPFNLTPHIVYTICSNYELVLSTIPAPVLCTLGHKFEKQDIWVIHGPGDHLIENVNDGSIMYYNGVPWDGSFAASEDDTAYDDGQGKGATFMRGHEWYRFSQINKYQAWEYSHKPTWDWEYDDMPDTTGNQLDGRRQLSEGIKPLWTNCACLMGFHNFHRLGRFGCWQKGVLTHHAYERALGVCRALQHM